MIEINDLKPYSSDKIISFEKASELIHRLKKEGLNVGLCHGGFDLLHPGHMKHFESAKKECDILFVSITSDQFVTSRKGQGRPVFSEQLRAYAVASVKFVDFVVITDFAKGIDVIEQLKPSYYIKGPDFIHKMTPGITAEREAIAKVGGRIRYTDDPTLSTTKIIDYVKNILDVKEILLIIDRDNTLIEDPGYFGRNDNWKEELKLINPVISFLSYLQTKYKTTKIVVSNQAGVARGYFDCQRVEEINCYLHTQLAAKGIKINNWQYCPEVDSVYAQLKKDEMDFDYRFVKDKTKRKPHSMMVEDALRELNRKEDEFAEIIVLGDKEDDDGGLARNLGAKFINVKRKSYDELVREFS